jgi:hypothetical protein
MLVKIVCSDGDNARCEGTAISGMAYGPESPEVMKIETDIYFAPALLGRNATQIQSILAHLERPIIVSHFPKSVLETALLDAHGKRLAYRSETCSADAGAIGFRLRTAGVRRYLEGPCRSRRCSISGDNESSS